MAQPPDAEVAAPTADRTASAPPTVLDRAVVAAPTMMYAIKQVELASRALLDEIVRPEGITALQYTAMTVLQRHRDPLSSADLARLSFVRAQSMTDLVGGLERRGLVAKRPDPANRRRLLIGLTADGSALLERLAPMVSRLEQRMLSGLTAGERADLARLLDATRRNLTSPR